MKDKHTKPHTPTKKASKPRGRPPKDLSKVNRSIPMDPEEFAKVLLNTPPGTIKKR